MTPTTRTAATTIPSPQRRSRRFSLPCCSLWTTDRYIASLLPLRGFVPVLWTPCCPARCPGGRRRRRDEAGALRQLRQIHPPQTRRDLRAPLCPSEPLCRGAATRRPSEEGRRSEERRVGKGSVST